MAKYEVIRSFPSKENVQRGQVFENPNWKNLGSLVRTGYLREIAEETMETESEETPKPRKKKAK